MPRLHYLNTNIVIDLDELAAVSTRNANGDFVVYAYLKGMEEPFCKRVDTKEEQDAVFLGLITAWNKT